MSFFPMFVSHCAMCVVEVDRSMRMIVASEYRRSRVPRGSA
jgi:hypothetical protein